MSYQFSSDGLELVGRLVRPDRLASGGVPALVICHGFPSRSNGRQDPGRSYYDLAERVSQELGWIALAITYRGCGESEGDSGWLSDVKNAAAHLEERDDVEGVWLAGFGTGGALAIAAAAQIDTIRGVAAIAPPADFDDWVGDPDGLLEYARKVRAVKDPEFPPDLDAWKAELGEIKSVDAAAQIGTRPLLIMHGADDQVVPVFDARVIADAHGGADLRIITRGSHRLRHDPRALAVLVGWLDRVQRAVTQ